MGRQLSLAAVAALAAVAVAQVVAPPTLAWSRGVPPQALGGRAGGVSWPSAAGQSPLVTFAGGRDAFNAQRAVGLTVSGTDGAITDNVALTGAVPDRAALAQVSDGTAQSGAAAGAPAAGTLFLFGGASASGAELNTTFVRRPGDAGFSLLTTTGLSPSARKSATLTYVRRCTRASAPTVGCLVLAGGERGGVPVTDVVYVLWVEESPPRWEAPSSSTGQPAPTPTPLATPPPHHSAAATMSSDGASAIIFGGSLGSTLSSDAWVFAPGGFADAAAAESANLAIRAGVWAMSDSVYQANPGGFGPYKAIDNNLNTACCTSCMHTGDAAGLTTNNPWLQLDLGSVQDIDAMTLYGRTDCPSCTGRFAFFQVYVGTTNVTGTGAALLPWVGTPASVTRIPNLPADIFGASATFSVGARGRFVWVMLPGNGRYMTVCEWQVWQRFPFAWRRISGLYNAALSQPTAQSTSERCCSGGEAGRAVDGIVDATNSYGVQPFSFTHTQDATSFPIGASTDAWWRVDLGAERDVQRLNVAPRLDCCTGAAAGAGSRTLRWEFYVGNNQDFNGNYKCPNTPADVNSNLVRFVANPATYVVNPNTPWITPLTAGQFAVIECAARGRYVHVRRIPVAGDNNILSIGEVQVLAQRLLNQPSARRSMAFASMRGGLLIFGGIDATGARLNEVRFLDIATSAWRVLPSATGSLPVARAAAFLAPLPNLNVSTNPLLTSINVPAPAATAVLFGGQSGSDVFNDINSLDFPRCPQLDMTGVATWWCTSAQSVCTFTCSNGYTSQNAGAVRCTPEGVWVGVLPVCRPPLPGTPSGVTATVNDVPVNSYTANATVTWSPVSGATRYRVRTQTTDFFETFEAGEAGISNLAAWTFYPSLSSNGFSLANKVLTLTSDFGTTYRGENGRQMPILYRSWPSTVNPAGDWAMETFVRIEADSRVPQANTYAGIGFMDMSDFNAQAPPVPGVFEYGLSLFFSGTWGLIAERSNGDWTTTPTIAPNGVNMNSFAWLRLERDTAAGITVYRTLFKNRAGDPWMVMPMVLQDGLLINGTTLPSSLRPALFIRSNSGTYAATAYFTYMRVSTLRCSALAATRVTPGSSTSTVIPGLTPGMPYLVTVEAGTNDVWGLASSAFSISVPRAPLPPLVNIVTGLRGGFSTLSSVYPTFPASNGFNNVFNDFFHSNQGWPYGDWMTVDLGGVAAVKNITIWNRQSCCQPRFDHASIFVGNWQSPPPNSYTGTSYSFTSYAHNVRVDPLWPKVSNQALGQPLLPVVPANVPITVPTFGLKGRFVTLNNWVRHLAPPGFSLDRSAFLHLAEVQVWAAGTSCAPRASFSTTQTSGNCGATTFLNSFPSPCVQACLPGLTRVVGATTATCDGEEWTGTTTSVTPGGTFVTGSSIVTQTGPICQATCGDLPTPLYATCRQTYLATNFSDSYAATFATQWASLDPTASPLGTTWAVIDGGLQSMARFSCGHDAIAVSGNEKLFAWTSAFALEAVVASSDKAGVVFKATSRNSFYRVYLDFVSGTHVIERMTPLGLVRLNDVFLALRAGQAYTLVVDVSAAGLISVTLDGVALLTTTDRTIAAGGVTGYSGVYASTAATFTWFRAYMPCANGVCSGLTDGDFCEFACATGLIPVGPTGFSTQTRRTCVQTATYSASYSPALPTGVPANQHVMCSAPPPTFTASTLLVNENSVTNALVGDPLLASSASPDFQLQFEILDGNINNTFWIDACSGQVKVRNPQLDFEGPARTYTLLVRVYIAGFALAETRRNITVVVTNLDESPVVYDQVCTLPENSPTGTAACTVSFWDPENSAVWFNVVADGSGGAFRLNNATGVISVGSINNTAPILNFEASPNSFPLILSATQRNDTTMTGSGRTLIQLVDVNDAPVIALGQVLRIVDSVAVASAVVGNVTATDEDTGAFASALTYSLVTGAAATTACGVPQAPALYPTLEQTATGSSIFAIDAATGSLRIVAAPSTPWSQWTPSQTPFGVSRALYWVCVRVADGFGGVDTKPVRVLVRPIDDSVPVITSISSVDYNTRGGETVTFSGSGFAPGGTIRPVTAWYRSNTLGTSYNATNCSVLSAGNLTCATVPGVGFDFIWTVYLDVFPVFTDITLGPATYSPPLVRSVNASSNLNTQGGGVVLISGDFFGPVTATPIVQFGAAFEYSCAPIANASDSHTVIRCVVPPGWGQSLTARVTIGGQTAPITGTFSYALPTISSITPVGTSFSLLTLDTVGGQRLAISGANFGPADSPLTLTFGRTTGTLMSLVSCTRGGGAAAHTSLNCTTPEGVGTNHSTAVAVGPGTTVFSAQRLGYLPPVITSISGPGARGADTAGGQQVIISGRYFGPLVFPSAFAPLVTVEAVTYGPDRTAVGLGIDVGRYTALSCRVTAASATFSTAECLTTQGVGANHAWQATIFGQVSNVFRANTSYAPPVITGFTDAGAFDADTVGGQPVTISGTNFGPADAYTNSYLSASYLSRLDNGPVANVTYVPANCAITVSHARITCTTAEGAGAALSWRLVIDGVASTQPTTSYAAPVIDDIQGADGLPVTAANPDGGDNVTLIGRFFGPPNLQGRGVPLVQSVSYGSSGSEYVLPRSMWRAVSHTAIAVTLLPGTGAGLRFRVLVADQTSAVSATTFSFAPPSIVAVYPPSAPTFSDPRAETVVSLLTVNLPLLDRSSTVSLTFGAGASLLTLPANVPNGPLSIAAATNYPDRNPEFGPLRTVNVTFRLPRDGAGRDIPVQLRVTPSGSTIPSSVTAITNASLFSYNAPTISAIIVSKPRFVGDNTSATGDAIVCPFPAGNSIWSCTDRNILQLTVVGDSFGADPAVMSYSDGVQRSVAQYLDLSADWRAAVPGGSSTNSFLWFPLDNRGLWSHTRVIVFVRPLAGTGNRPQTQGRLRISLTSTNGANGVVTQSVESDWANLSPSIGNLRGAVSDIPTTGGTAAAPLYLDAENLAGAIDAAVFFGGVRGTILNPVTLVPAVNVKAEVIDTQNTVWTIPVIVPPGQGANVPVELVMTSASGSLDRSNSGNTISYRPPSLAAVYVVSTATGAVVSNSTTTNGVVVSVPTDGASARLRFTGADLGPRPSIAVGDSWVLTFDAGQIVPCAGTGNASHTCYEALAPPGEGAGALLPEYPNGYTVSLLAGNQETPALPFRYDSPRVSGVRSSTGAFPTRGGVVISVIGTNFGEKKAGRPDAPLVVRFGDASTQPAAALQECLAPLRISHTLINCTLPEGSGNNLPLTVTVADLVATSFPTPLFRYDAPRIGGASAVPAAAFNWSSLPGAAAGARAARRLQSLGVLRGNTTGGDVLMLSGSDFGLASPRHCAFLAAAWRAADAAQVPTCDGFENFLGEGEVPAANVLYWSHDVIAFAVPPGIGLKDVDLSIRGSTVGGTIGVAASWPVRFRYNAPWIARLTPATGDTEGGTLITIEGANFGPTPLTFPYVANNATGVNASSLPQGGVFGQLVPLAAAPSLPTTWLAVVITRNGTTYRAVATSARTIGGAKPPIPNSVASAGDDVTGHTHTAITFRLPAGVGAGRTVVVEVYDGAQPRDGAIAGSTITSNGAAFAYSAPEIYTYTPNTLRIEASRDAGFPNFSPVDVRGQYFGNRELADAQGWTAADREVFVSVGASACRPERTLTRREDGQTVVQCGVDSSNVTVGAKAVTLRIAGQTTTAPNVSTVIVIGGRNFVVTPLIVGCALGSYGRVTAGVGEVCLPCPSYNDNPGLRGAECRGYTPDGFHTYPRPLPGFFNLNSSDRFTRANPEYGSMLSACPPSAPDTGRETGRDVCIVGCEPKDACLGDNECATGYASKPPAFRCASCAKQYYKRGGTCVKCPDSPYALVIGFVLIVLAAAILGYILNKRAVDIAVISIGVDYFQVLAIFAQSKVKWPAQVQELLHVLSAFNLNIEIVAPECLVPDVQYQQKFAAIILLPAVVAIFLGLLSVALVCHKALVLGRRKGLGSHMNMQVASFLVLFYFLYLYETRTMLDVFNCVPVDPPDGKLYLASSALEECGKPGGTQELLTGPAIIGLIVYTFGYPFFLLVLLWKNRELVMEDQLLRAKGVGADRLSNPHAYDFRKRFHRSYYQFKPDLCLWIVVIILRKFCIAVTSVLFNKNAAFQMAACLLVMFGAYALQLQYRPYMSPGDYEEVLKSHLESSYASAVHARLRQSIAAIESRGRKKARKNLMTFDGKVDRSALLSAVYAWFFNYNTVEAQMLSSAVLVCLMGIMYQAISLSSSNAYSDARDAITSVVLAVIIISIIYFAAVVFGEIFVLYTEADRQRRLAKNAAARRGSKKAAGDESGEKRGLASAAGGADAAFNPGAVDSAVNPMFLNAGGSGGAAGAEGAGAPSSVSVEAIAGLTTPPPPELWSIIRTEYAALHERTIQLAEQLAAEKQARQRLEANAAGGGDDDDMPRPAVVSSRGGREGREKHQFAPTVAAGASANPLGSRRGVGVALSQMRGR